MIEREINKVDTERVTNELMETLLELRKTMDSLTNPFLLIMRSGKKGITEREYVRVDVDSDKNVESYTIKETSLDRENKNIPASRQPDYHLMNKTIKTELEKSSDLPRGDHFNTIKSARGIGQETVHAKAGHITYVEKSTSPIVKARILKRLFGSHLRDVLNSLETAGLVNSRECIQLTSLLQPEQKEKKIESSIPINVILTTFIVNVESVPINLAFLYGGGNWE